MRARRGLSGKEDGVATYLERILPLLYEWDLTLVLLCRDKGDGSAAWSVLELLHRLRLTHVQIHKHCFSGSREEVKSWLHMLLLGARGLSSVCFFRAAYLYQI
jgi:Tat protein secretion system quality control protein TatD with DNase activity